MGKMIATGLGEALDRFTPYAWAVRIALGLFAGLLIVLALNYASCSRQEAAQSKQGERSATAGTKTAVEALDTLQEAQERDAGTDRIVAQGKKDIANAKSDLEVDAAGRAALCRMRIHRHDPACRLPSVHP